MDRSTGRTVFIYDAKGDYRQLGGLINTHGITTKNFHEMLEAWKYYWSLIALIP